MVHVPNALSKVPRLEACSLQPEAFFVLLHPSISYMDEHKLIEGLLQGDNNAFRELVSLYQDHVYNTIICLVRDKEEALDLSQDVFVEIYQSIPRFRKESSLQTWIYRIAVNKALNYLNKKEKGNFISRIQSIFSPGQEGRINEIKDEEKHPHDKLENEELSRQLQQAVDSLPKNQRIAFILHKMEDLPYKEIARIMDISLSSVESLIFRARKGLQDRLLEHFQQ
jgi:RNA polymerase sigma-70 factor (family 1)